MLKTIADALGRDPDYSARQHRLSLLLKVLDGSLYDHLLYPFAQERMEGSGEYIPILKRRPSVRYRLAATVVEDSVSLLFGDGRFPAFDCADPQTRRGLERLAKALKLNQVMLEAATLGSIGSVAILVRVLNNRLFAEVKATPYLTPVWKRDAPDVLEKVTERFKVKGEALGSLGYDIAPEAAAVDFWFQREWDSDAETWHLPVRWDDPRAANPPVDESRTVRHGLGFLPLIWIKNLPGGDAIDGAATLPREAIETGIEIDYQLSQAGRGLRYASDPTLLIKEPAGADDANLIRSASQALIVSAEGDAKLLEISGSASQAVVDYCRTLRDLALEGAHGSRVNPDKLAAAQSGRAMELLNQPLIWLADRLRAAYGEGGLLPLTRLLIALSTTQALVLDDGPLPPLDPNARLGLVWPKWFAPTYSDSQVQAETFVTLTKAGLMSRASAVRLLAPTYDIDDVDAELARLMAEANPQAETPAPHSPSLQTPSPKNFGDSDD